MIRLIRAETNRLLARRITWGFPAVLAVLIIVGVVIAFIFVSEGDFSLVDNADGRGRSDIFGPLIPIMGFVLGASFIGADLKSGMLEHLLTWEPRRTRLLGARMIGGAIVTSFIVTLLYIFLTAALFVLGILKDGTDGVGQEWWLDVLSGIGRSCIVGALMFILGVALATIMNSSVGAIVTFVIYAFVVESVLFLLPVVWRWLPLVNANSFSGAYGVPAEPMDLFGNDVHHNYWWAGALLAGYVLAFTIPAILVFRRRDIS